MGLAFFPFLDLCMCVFVFLRDQQRSSLSSLLYFGRTYKKEPKIGNFIMYINVAMCCVKYQRKNARKNSSFFFLKFGDYMNIDYRKQKNEKINNVERDIW